MADEEELLLLLLDELEDDDETLLLLLVVAGEASELEDAKEVSLLGLLLSSLVVLIILVEVFSLVVLVAILEVRGLLIQLLNTKAKADAINSVILFFFIARTLYTIT